jgi:hypothetical protein
LTDEENRKNAEATLVALESAKSWRQVEWCGEDSDVASAWRRSSAGNSLIDRQNLEALHSFLTVENSLLPCK